MRPRRRYRPELPRSGAEARAGAGVTELRVEDLHKGFRTQQVLRGLDLHVPAGSVTAVLGPSGSGKTTLLRVVAGFERADQGTVRVGATVVDDAGSIFVPPERRGIGYVPQEGALFPHLNVERNVAFGLPRARRRCRQIGELLEMVGLGGLGRRYPHQLSGGQQQRVALARALAIDPALVLLDEPFSSLDAGLRQSVRDDVAAVLRDQGTTAVLVTHDQDEALSMADQVAVIHEGRVGQVDRPELLYRRPRDPEVATFLGEANMLQGRFSGSQVRTALGLLDVMAADGSVPRAADGADAVVLVRPEHLALDAADQAVGLRGTVTSYRYFGHDAVVTVTPAGSAATDGPDELVVRVAGGDRWEPGTAVAVRAVGPVLAWPAERAARVDAGAVPAPNA